MLKWLISKVRQIVRGIREMATFWTSIGVMLIPIGLAVLIQWPKQSIIAFGLIIIGGVLGAIGLGFTLRDKRKADNKEEEDRQRREDEQKLRESEHLEYLATLRTIAKQISGKPLTTEMKIERETKRIARLKNDKEDFNKEFGEGDSEDEL
jgi:hypothetical protein